VRSDRLGEAGRKLTDAALHLRAGAKNKSLMGGS